MSTPNTQKSPCFAVIVWLCLATPLLATPEIQVKGGSTISPFSLNFGGPLTESEISFNNIQKGEPVTKAKRGTIFGERGNARDPLVRVGESVAHYFRIYNRGDQTLSITSVTFDDAQFSATDTNETSPMMLDGTSVAADEQMTFFIHFTPTSSGPATALCSITTNDPDDSLFTFSLFGDAVGVISVGGGPLSSSPKQNIARGDTTPSEIDGTDFEVGEVGAANPNTSYFEITNGDNEPIDIALIGLVDFPGGGTSGRTHFSIAPAQTGPSTIPPFSTRSFQVDYDPLSDGIHETYVGINVVDAPTSFVFKLRGMTPQFPDSKVYSGSGGPFRPGTLVVDNNPTSTGTLTDFGEVTVGGVTSGPYQSTGERQHRFRMSNPGTAPLVIGTATSSSTQFQVTVPNPTVAEGDSQFLFIKFLPTNSGTKTAFITLPTNDPDNPAYRINVTGVAIGASLLVSGSQDIVGPFNAITSNQIPVVTNGTRFLLPHLLSDPPQLNFFKFTNNGAGPLDITGITLAGSHPGDFFAFQGGAQYIGTIDAGATLDMRFGFSPITDGVRTTQIAIATNDPDTPTFFLRLHGESTLGPIAALSGRRNETGSFGAIGNPGVTPADNNGTLFDDVGVGNAAQNGFQLTNNGDALLKNLTFTSSLSDFSFSGAPTDVSPGATADFAIKFNPTAAGTRRAKITITAGPVGNTPYTFDVAADVSGPRFSLKAIAASGGQVPIADNDFSPSETDGTEFGEAYVDNAASSKFEIANLGDQPLDISSILFVGGGASHFNVSGISTPLTIDPNKTAEFNINFDPTNGGSKSATIQISTNDPDLGLFQFSVRGTAITRPAIAVAGRPGSAGSFVAITPGSTTPTSANGTEFPAAAPGSTTTHEVRLTNSGDTALTIAKVVSDRAEISVDNIPNGTVIAPGNNHVFGIGLKPSGTGPVSGRITIANDDPLQPAYSFLVEGPGSKPTMEVYYTAGATDYFIANNFVYTDEPSGTNFGPIEFGQNQTHTFEFRNTGTENLKVINEGGGGGQFDLIGQIQNDGSVTILPGAVSPFSIRYSPSSVGIHSGSHLFSTDDPEIDGEEFTLNLTGTATGQAELEVLGEGFVPTTAFRGINTNVRPSIDSNATIFPESSLALGASRRLKLVNTGNAPLEVSDIISTNPVFSVDANTATIAPGAEWITNLNFDPNTSGQHAGSISILYDDSASTGTFRFGVSGFGSGKTIIVRGGDDLQEDIADGDLVSDAIDGTLFPQLTPNLDSITRTFEIVNYGTQVLKVNSITFSGGNSSEFEIVSLYPNGLLGLASGTIPVAGTATFLIKYEPTAAGARFTDVRIATSSLANPIYEFRITGGNGVFVREASVYLTNSTGALVRHGDSPRADNGTDLGLVAPSTPRGALIHIVNPRSTSVTVTDLVAAHPGFSFIKFPGELAPGTSKFFLLVFDGAPLPGVYETPISVLTTDPIAPTITFTVRATVGAAVVPDPDVTSYMPDGDDIVLELDAPLGITFRVATSTDLVTWFEVPGQTGFTAGTIRLTNVFGQPASDPRRFYKVDQE